MSADLTSATGQVLLTGKPADVTSATVQVMLAGDPADLTSATVQVMLSDPPPTFVGQDGFYIMKSDETLTRIGP